MLVLRIAGSLLSIYSILITLRIIFSWIQAYTGSRAPEFLCRVTDPYLDYFRRFSFLRFGPVDFSPALGIILLFFAQNLIDSILVTQTFSLFSIIIVALSLVYSLINFILLFFIVLSVIRILVHYLNANPYSRLVYTIDSLLRPLADFIKARLPGDRIYPNHHILLISLALLIGAWLALSFIYGLLANSASV